MAITAQSMLAKATIYRNDIVDQFNKTTPFLSWIPKKYNSGDLNVSWKVNTGGATAFTHAEGADFSTYDQDVRAAATLSWKEMAASFGVTGLAQATAQAGNPFAGEDPGKTEVLSHSRELAYLIETELFAAGTGLTTHLTGLDVAIGSAANTYAGIDRATAAYWRPYVIDPGSLTALTKDQIRVDVDAILEACGQRPDTIVVTPAVARKIIALYEVDLKFNVGPGGAPNANFGLAYNGFTVEGMNVLVARTAGASKMYYLNSNHIALHTLNTYNAGVLAAMQEQADAYGTGSLIDVAPPLLFNYEKLAKTGDSDKAFVKWKGQLVVDRPQAHGVRLNVAIA